jgi:soluble lytic murein transglycosylase
MFGLSAVIVLGVGLAACSGSGSRSPHPESAGREGARATPTAGPSPTPSRAPADAALAAQLRYDGQYEQAIDVYAAVATAESGDARQQALLAQAQLLTRTGRFQEARDVLQTYLAAAGSAADARAARYMLASTLDDLGDPRGALDNYDLYIAGGGAASDFARIERAKMLARLGRALDAEAAAEAVLASDIDASFKASFTFSMASAFEQGGGDANALAWYARVLATPGGDEASALARIGGIKKRLGDATWSADYLQAITTYPGSGSAPDLLDTLDASAVPVGDYVRGLVCYRARRDDAALTAFARAAAAGDHPAEAHYYIAAIEERSGKPDAAIADYAMTPAIDPASPLAPDALWWRARLLEQAKRWPEAVAGYQQIATQYPSSDRAEDAAFRHALVEYLSGDKASAISDWSALAARTSGEDNERARFWQGRALIEQNGPNNDGVLKQLIADAPAGFYGLRAAVLLKQNDAGQHGEQLDAGAPDWAAIARYIQQQTGTDPSQPGASDVASDPRWAQAQALADVELTSQSGTLFSDIIAAHNGDPVALYVITKQLSDQGRASLAARSATRLVAAIPRSGSTQPPASLLRLAYPVVYRALVARAADQNGISPLLLLALIRQESFYDPDAGSTAGALGLTQVVPSTAQPIAKALGETGFTPDDLFRPNVNVRFGADYLATQLRDFKSDNYRALAAYNGGPGAAQAAAAGAGSDEDLFVEDLEFDETKTYVKRVLEYYAQYRQLYEHIKAPSLAR